MPIDILMPALSPTMDKGHFKRWLKSVGDSIKAGDIIAEIETDKATMEIEAVDEGTLATILIQDDTADVPVNARIGVLALEGESLADIEAQATVSKPASKMEKSQHSLPEKSPRVLSPTVETASRSHSGSEVRQFASPLARRRAKERNVDLQSVSGSGPHGRIIEKDILTFASLGGGQSAAAALAISQPLSQDGSAPPFSSTPISSMRRIIAERLQESKRTVPHYYLTIDCCLDGLMALREQINGDSDIKISVNDFVIKAHALALARVPEANMTWTDEALIRYESVDVGVAVAIPDGLITPIIRSADRKSLSEISREMKDLAKRGKDKRLKPEEYQGGSTAISNLGMYGIRQFAAIINPPQSTILAVGSGEKRVIVRDNLPAVAMMMTVTLSADHRVVDGALGATLLSTFKQLIENPVRMLV
jgi:pyruvate dehydrogenase E2 component (dihydrolipoamide acetyltransferase)